ncbi:hypothetical protein DBR32_13320 [Taibaiella sp. KBW10]|uniref:O-antigen ligase family protein n=1 Tax=Taibaiella sp. KBW10 TaxID=2153357 RepID=UPI000F59DD37|nr:O-antigen ligase family protein [Taibaiella sp. KBW10]RQO30538.1 hypothetical protein DBR32_13320 [Taibaiella sp. KBW10]
MTDKRPIALKKDYSQLQNWTAVLACLMMIAGMLHARALVSIGVILLFINACLPGSFNIHWQLLKKSRFAQLAILFFASYLISGLWSTDTAAWGQKVVIKLPFLLLPFGFLSLPTEKIKYLRIVIYGISAILMFNVFQSLSVFFQNSDYYIQSYGASKLIPTSIYNDYIRFSLTLVLTILLNLYLLIEKWTQLKSWDKVLIGIIILVLTAFNHLLATKTGLLSFYMMIAIIGFGKLFKKKKIFALLFVLLLPLLAFIAYLKVPTIRAKVDYVQKEIALANTPNAQLDYNYSDQGRIISYQLALNIIKAKPIFGVGVGDVTEEMKKEYEAHYPAIPEANRLIPHNQLLYVLVALGSVLSLIFILMISAPLCSKGPQAIYPIAVAAVLIFALMVEPMLEVQFGVLVYLFFTLFVWRLRLDKTTIITTQALS